MSHQTGPAAPEGLAGQLSKVQQRADMFCTAHSRLKARFALKALGLDLFLFGLSSWLVAMAFVEPRINLKLTPFGIDSQIWVGLLSVGTFFLTILQLRTNWKGTSEAHERTLDLFAEVKQQARLMQAEGTKDELAIKRILENYNLACKIGIDIPEGEFLNHKRAHLLKRAISNHIDNHPAASVILLRIRFWLRDNVRG